MKAQKHLACFVHKTENVSRFLINVDKKSGYETILLNLFVSLIFPGNNL